MEVLQREHRLKFYTPGGGGDGSWGSGDSSTGWTPVAGAETVPAEMEFMGGSIRATAAGQQMNVSARAFVDPEDWPAGYTPEQGHGVEVVAGRTGGERRFRIKLVNPAGDRSGGWIDDVLVLEDLEEEFS